MDTWSVARCFRLQPGPHRYCHSGLSIIHTTQTLHRASSWFRSRSEFTVNDWTSRWPEVFLVGAGLISCNTTYAGSSKNVFQVLDNRTVQSSSFTLLQENKDPTRCSFLSTERVFLLCFYFYFYYYCDARRESRAPSFKGSDYLSVTKLPDLTRRNCIIFVSDIVQNDSKMRRKQQKLVADISAKQNRNQTVKQKRYFV